MKLKHPVRLGAHETRFALVKHPTAALKRELALQEEEGEAVWRRQLALQGPQHVSLKWQSALGELQGVAWKQPLHDLHQRARAKHHLVHSKLQHASQRIHDELQAVAGKKPLPQDELQLVAWRNHLPVDKLDVELPQILVWGQIQKPCDLARAEHSKAPLGSAAPSDLTEQ